MIFFSFLILAWIGLLTILLWDLIQKGQNKLYMFILIPASLVLTITTYFTVQGLLGYPTENYKEIRFRVLATAVQNQNGYIIGSFILVTKNQGHIVYPIHAQTMNNKRV